MWQKGIQPSELDKMSYWEFEEFIKMMNERNKEEEEHQKKQSAEQELAQKKYTPQIPNMSNFNPSNFRI